MLRQSTQPRRGLPGEHSTRWKRMDDPYRFFRW
jgi:hypothetical protein